MRNRMTVGLVVMVALAAAAGGIYWANHTSESTDQAMQGLNDAISSVAQAQQAAGDYPRYVQLGDASRCTVNKPAKLIAFHIALHNNDTFASSSTIRPVVLFADGARISSSSYDRSLNIPKRSGRVLEIVVPYNPKRHRPSGCRVTISDGNGGPVKMARSSAMA